MRVSEVIAELLAEGMEADRIAYCLRVPLEVVAQIEPADRVGDERTIESFHNLLTIRAYRASVDIIENGTPTQRMALIRSVYGTTARGLALKSPKELDAMKAELEGLMVLEPQLTEEEAAAYIPEDDDDEEGYG